jgi:periplasmic protein TonB
MLVKQIDRRRHGVVALLVAMVLHVGIFYVFWKISSNKQHATPLLKEVRVLFISSRPAVQAQSSIRPLQQERARAPSVARPNFSPRPLASVADPKIMEPVSVDSAKKPQRIISNSTRSVPSLEKSQEGLDASTKTDTSGAKVMSALSEKQEGEDHKLAAKSDNVGGAKSSLTPSPYSLDAPKQVSSIQYISPPVKEYPKKSIEQEEEGKVLLSILIDETGHPQSVEIKHTSGYSRLDEAAKQSLQKALFKPYTENGRAIPVRCVLPVTFSLEDEGSG